MVKLIAIENATALTFRFWMPGPYYFLCYPGRTWITRDWIEFPEYDPNRFPQSFQFRCWSESPSSGKDFYLALRGQELLQVDDKNQPKVVARLPADVPSKFGVQLTVRGTTWENLNFVMRNNCWPSWESEPSLVGVMNNSKSTISLIGSYYGQWRWDDRVIGTVEPGKFFSFFNPQEERGFAIPSIKTLIGQFSVKVKEVDPYGGQKEKQWSLYKDGPADLRQAPFDEYVGASRLGRKVDQQQWNLISGGHSQADSPFKYLEVTANGTLRMVERASQLISALDRIPLASNLFVASQTDLLFNNYEEVPGTKELKEFTSFVTRIRFTDENQTAIAGGTIVEMSIDPPNDAIVNGVSIPAQADKIYVKMDLEGVVTVTQRAPNNLGSVNICVSASSISNSGKYVINTGAALEAKLKDMKTPYDWTSLQYSSSGTSSPVFPDPQKIIGISKPLNDLIQMLDATGPFNVVVPPLNNSVSTALSLSELGMTESPYHAPGKPFVAHLPEGWMTTFDFAKGEIYTGEKARLEHNRSLKRSRSRSALPQGLSSGSSSDLDIPYNGAALPTYSSPPLASAAGDDDPLWKKICDWAARAWDKISKISFSFSNGVLTISFNGGPDSLVKSVAEVMASIGAVFIKICGAAFEKLGHWLGEVLDWKTINTSYNLVKTLHSSALANLGTCMENLRTVITALKAPGDFSSYLKLSKSDYRPNNVKPTTASSDANKQLESDSPNVSSAVRSPTFNWTINTLANNQKSSSWSLGPSDPAPLAILEQLCELGLPFMDRIAKLKDKWVDPAQKMTILDVASELWEMLASTAEGLIKSCIEKTTSFLAINGLVEAVKALMDIKCPEIPVLTRLWKDHIADKTKKTDPSVADMAHFIVAVPLAYAAKLAYLTTGQAFIRTDLKIPNIPKLGPYPSFLNDASINDLPSAVTSSAVSGPSLSKVCLFVSTSLQMVSLTSWTVAELAPDNFSTLTQVLSVVRWVTDFANFFTCIIVAFDSLSNATAKTRPSCWIYCGLCLVPLFLFFKDMVVLLLTWGNKPDDPDKTSKISNIIDTVFGVFYLLGTIIYIGGQLLTMRPEITVLDGWTWIQLLGSSFNMICTYPLDMLKRAKKLKEYGTLLLVKGASQVLTIAFTFASAWALD